MPGEPNPEAIGWYLRRSETLLADRRERVLSLRTRGSQLAGFAGAVLALAGANVEAVLDALQGVSREFAGGSLLVGVLLLVGSLVTVLRGTVLPELLSVVSVEEVGNYVTERFIHEPDLWRVHLRTILTLLDAIETTTDQGDQAARAVRKAEYFFFAGLFTVGVAFATLIAVVTF
jgi:hypothetical protein